MFGKKVLNQLSAYKQGMQISEVKKKYNLTNIVKLASNENPYGFSPKVIDTINSMIPDYQLYPDGYTGDLRNQLSLKLGVLPNQLVFGAGSDEIITFICRAFLESGTNTVMATPTFPQYRHHALIEGAIIKEIPTVNGEHDLDSMLEAIDENTKVVWLCTPDNPTGSVITQDSFDSFMDRCRKDVIVVLDEAYFEYVDESLQFNMLDHLEKYPNIIILRTFSKIYGLAGFRLGYGISHESIAEKLNIVRGPFNTTSVTQRVVMTALEDKEFMLESKKKNEDVRNSFQHFLTHLGWDYYPSQTNFLLVKIPLSSSMGTEYLLQHGYIVRSGEVLGYPNTIRITLGTEKEMLELQQILEKLNKKIQNEADR